MREIIYALLYLTCAAVLTAFPVCLLFVLFGEQRDVGGSERTPALVSRILKAKTPDPAETPAHEDTRPRPQPAWIVPTPKYEYDRPSIAPTGADALEAFAAEMDHENTRERSTRIAKERQVVTPHSRPAFGEGGGEFYREINGREVFDTPPLAPD